MNGLPSSHHFMPGMQSVGQVSGNNTMPGRPAYNNSNDNGLGMHNALPNGTIGMTMVGSPIQNPIHSVQAPMGNGMVAQAMSSGMGVAPVNGLGVPPMGNGLTVPPLGSGLGVPLPMGNGLSGSPLMGNGLSGPPPMGNGSSVPPPMGNGLGITSISHSLGAAASMTSGMAVAHSPNSQTSMTSSPYGMPNLLQTQSTGPPSVPTNCDFNGNVQHSLQANQPQQGLQSSQNENGSTIIPNNQSSGINQQTSKEINTASLCRIGQETVQDIVSRTQDVFQTLKMIQPPNGTAQSSSISNDKKVKVQEQLRTIRVLFKRLRLIYEKCNENCQLPGMEYTHIESLIPFKDEMDPKHDEKKNTEVYRAACDESDELLEQVLVKNKQLKEALDQLRRIIWEINTMLTMRRS